MSESATPDSGPLTVDQAIAMQLPPEPAEEPAQEAPVEAAEGEQAEGAASAPEEAEGEAEEPAEAEETEAEAEAVEPVDPPKYWSQDAKARFAELPPELQAVVLEQEGPREEAAAKAKSEAAAEKQAAQAEIGKVQQLADHLSEFLPQAIEAFKSRWGEAPDWKAYAEEYGAEAMIIAKVEHEDQLALLQQTARATEIAQTEARQAQVDAEFIKLAEIAPDLADPVEGQKRRAEITRFLEDAGLPKADIRNISAVEMTLARDAKLYREAQAALKTRPTPKPASAPAPRSPVRPAAAPAQPSNRTAQQNAQARFNLNPSRENAEALLLAKG